MQYVIFIAVVIALLIFAFISLSYVQQAFKLKANTYIATIHNTNLAIDYSTKNRLNYNEQIDLSFSETTNEKTTAIKKSWGTFDIITATATTKNESFTKQALLGGLPDNPYSLYLQDNNQPLVVVGATRIEGNVQLPKQGIKRGTIAGNSFTGNQMVYGTIGLSTAILPQLKNREYLKELCKGSFQPTGTESIALIENSIIKNSFKEKTKNFTSNELIDLRNIQLTGNISIQSNSMIRVHETAELTDVLLIAPKIEILDNVKGTFQAFASKEIIVGKNCRLNYPSGLTIYEKKSPGASFRKTNKEFNKIEIQKGSELRGIISFLSENKENNYKPQVLLEESARVIGEIYCEGNFELKGTVTGSVYTKGFIANQFGSVYQNHIYNGKILFDDFPKEYSGLLLNITNQSVAKWLY